MEFWKEHIKLRSILIAVLSVTGFIAVIEGWRLTGQLEGLGIMFVGVCLLLVALWIYNKPYGRAYKKKS